MKNPQFCFNKANDLEMSRAREMIIFTKFHKNRMKIAVFIIIRQIQWLSIENQQGCDNNDVSFILTIFPKNFWNK